VNSDAAEVRPGKAIPSSTGDLPEKFWTKRTPWHAKNHSCSEKNESEAGSSIRQVTKMRGLLFSRDFLSLWRWFTMHGSPPETRHPKLPQGEPSRLSSKGKLSRNHASSITIFHSRYAQKGKGYTPRTETHLLIPRTSMLASKLGWGKR